MKYVFDTKLQKNHKGNKNEHSERKDKSQNKTKERCTKSVQSQFWGWEKSTKWKTIDQANNKKGNSNTQKLETIKWKSTEKSL